MTTPSLVHRPPFYNPRLTSTQMRTLRMAARGMTTTDIAREEFVSERTIKNRIQAAAQELGARNRVHAVAKAYEWGLLVPSDEGRRG